MNALPASVYSAAQVRAMDAHAIGQLGIPVGEQSVQCPIHHQIDRIPDTGLRLTRNRQHLISDPVQHRTHLDLTDTGAGVWVCQRGRRGGCGADRVR